MSLITVRGMYKDGEITLDELPGGVGSSARVIVTFLPESLDKPEAGAELAADDPHRGAAAARLMAILREGIPLGGPPYPAREQLHRRGRCASR